MKRTRACHAKALAALCAIAGSGFGAAEACTSQIANTRSPYEASKFHSVMDASKLQAPTSSTCYSQGTGAGKLSNTNSFNKWYYAPYSQDTMIFSMTRDILGLHQRVELRQEVEWSVNDSRKMIGEVKADEISDDLTEFTFMQLHHAEAGAKPIVRLRYHRSRSGVEHGIWAIYRACADSGSSCNTYTNALVAQWRPGVERTTFRKFEIRVDQNILKVKFNGVTKFVQELDESYGSKLLYFKAGAYLQDPGTATLSWDSLKYY